jgi:hypothetical protein
VVLGVIAIAFIVALGILNARREIAHRWLLLVAIVPLLLTVVVPLPFSLTAQGPTVALRAKLIGVTRVGIILSFILSAIGILLLLQALFRRDRQMAILLGLETALAALPAVIFVVFYAVFR